MFFLFSVLCSFVFVLNERKHFLVVLLGLELLLLSVCVICLKVLVSVSVVSGVNLCVLVLVLGVCDSSYGLGLLVSRSRKSGLDQLGTVFSVSC